jgi:multidrug transporter EmrE-like cation transporter
MSAAVLGSLLALVVGSSTIAGNMMAKEWAHRGGWMWYAAALLLFIAGSALLPFAVRHSFLSTVSTISSFTVIIGMMAIGLFYYREQVSLTQAIGLILAVAAIILLFWPK